MPSEPAPAVDIHQTILRNEGQATALEVGQHTGPLTVNLQTHSTPPRAARALVPPATRAAFFGRSKQLDLGQSALRDGQTMLLHGMPGIGKTALAANVMERVYSARGVQEGVLWVSEVADAPVAAICDAIARHLDDDAVLKLDARAKPDATRALLAAHSKLLIVLDHLASAETAREVIEVCLPRGVAMLATSRTWLKDFEAQVSVPELDPADAQLLFLNRAGLEQPDPVAGDICKLLGNHPLALVIAAGRVRGEDMPLRRLWQRLADEQTRLGTLSADDAAADPSRNIKASFNLSYAALSEPQKLVLTRLAACFGDTTDLELLAEICGMTTVQCEDRIGELVARSLVERSGDQIGMQLLVRDFGRAELGSQATTVRERVLDVILHYAARYGDNSVDHHTRLEPQLPNLLGALRYAFDHQLWPNTLALAKSIGQPVSGVLAVRGYWTELLGVDQLACAAAAELKDDRELAQWQVRAAIGLHRRGNYDAAGKLYEQSHSTFATLGDQDGMARSLHNLAMLAIDQGNYLQARRLFGDVLKIRALLNDPLGEARTLNELGRLASSRGDLARARRYYLQSLKTREPLGDAAGTALCLLNLAWLACEQGDQSEARGRCQASLDLFTSQQDKQGQAMCHNQFGRIAHARGEYDDAGRQYLRALSIFEGVADSDNIAECTYDLGRLSIDQQRFDDARAQLGRSLDIRQKQNNCAGEGTALREQGRLALLTGSRAAAHTALERSLALAHRVGDRIGQARALQQLGCLVESEGNLAEATRLYGDSLKLSEHIGLQPEVELNRRLLAALAAAAQQGTSARSRTQVEDHRGD